MDLKHGNPAVALLFTGYNVVLAGIWVLRAPEQTATPFMVLLHVALAFLLMEMPRPDQRSRLPLRILHGVYPFVLWTLAWSEIGWLYELTSPAVHDQAVMAADLALFRFHPNQVLAGLLDWGWLQDVMGLSYLSYYLLILGPPLFLGLKNRTDDLQDHSFALMSTYLACFLIYLVAPVLGPRDLAQAAGDPAPGVGGLFGPVIQAFFEAGDSLGTAFPSSHCAGSVASALSVRRHFGSTAGRIALGWVFFIVVSTVYTNNHYALDAVAGVATAWVTLKMAALVRSGRPAAAPRKSPRIFSARLNITDSPDSGPKGGLS